MSVSAQGTSDTPTAVTGTDNVVASKRNIAVPVITYHLISDEPGDWSDYCISSKKFEDDLIYIKLNGFTPIFASEYKLLQEGMIDVVNPIILTIDDGYASDYSRILPIIERHEVKANFFVIGNMIYYRFHWGLEYMDRYVLHEFAKSDYVEIGNHSFRLHLKPYAELRALCNDVSRIDEIIADYRLSEQFIEETIGKEITTISFPYGIVPAALSKFLEQLPYDVIFSTHEKMNRTQTDYILGRYNRADRFSTKAFYDSILYRAVTANKATVPAVVQGEPSLDGIVKGIAR